MCASCDARRYSAEEDSFYYKRPLSKFGLYCGWAEFSTMYGLAQSKIASLCPHTARVTGHLDAHPLYNAALSPFASYLGRLAVTEGDAGDVFRIVMNIELHHHDGCTLHCTVAE